ncbi:MAG: peptidase, partial [Bradyrhizobium sp.]
MSFRALLWSARSLALLSAVAAAAFAGGNLRAQAQAMMRSPTINIPSRTPIVTNIPSRTPSINAGAALRAPPPHLPGVAVRPSLPNARYSPNLQAACSPADRSASGECLDRPPLAAEAGQGGSAMGTSAKGKSATGKSANGKSAKAGQRREPVAATDPKTVANELVAEIDGSLSTDQADALARRHRLQRVSSQAFPLIGATIGLFRITDRRSVETVSRALAADRDVRSVQPNYRYALQQQMSP